MLARILAFAIAVVMVGKAIVVTTSPIATTIINSVIVKPASLQLRYETLRTIFIRSLRPNLAALRCRDLAAKVVWSTDRIERHRPQRTPRPELDVVRTIEL